MGRSFRYQRTFRVKAAEDRAKPGKHVSWRVRVDKAWRGTPDGPVVLRPYFDEGWIGAVKLDDWKENPLERELTRLERLLSDRLEDAAARDVRRIRASALYDSYFGSGNITIPSLIVWLLQQNARNRDLTVVNAGPYLEIWPTTFWRRRMLGLPARATAPSSRPAETPAKGERA